MRQRTSPLLIVAWLASLSTAFVLPTPQRTAFCTTTARRSSSKGPDENNDEGNPSDRTTFDQAGASLIEEEDRKRMEEMGDFDANPAYQNDAIEKMRAAIRARTETLGLEKSKLSAEYIENRRKEALQAGPQQDREKAAASMFGGVDLTKITADGGGKGGGSNQWDEEMPSMFYDPDDELSVEERQQIDPVMTKNILEQGLNELSNAKWPTFASAGREVVLMALVVAFSAALIIGADTALRALYTNVGFIPSPDELNNYASRFDGLDLPDGWMNNMSDQDMAKLADQVNPVVPTATSVAPATTTTSGSLLPDL